MNEILKFIKNANIFYIATIDGDKPRVRPFAFAMEYQGKLYFCTSNQKDVYRQLTSNPWFEASTMSKDGQWMRLQGKAVFDSNKDAKANAFEIQPGLEKIYNNPDLFEVFYVEQGEATFYNMKGESRTIKL